MVPLEAGGVATGDGANGSQREQSSRVGRRIRGEGIGRGDVARCGWVGLRKGRLRSEGAHTVEVVITTEEELVQSKQRGSHTSVVVRNHHLHAI